MCGGQGREVGAVLFDVGDGFFVGAVVGQMGKPDMVGSDFAGGFQGLGEAEIAHHRGHDGVGGVIGSTVPPPCPGSTGVVPKSHPISVISIVAIRIIAKIAAKIILLFLITFSINRAFILKKFSLKYYIRVINRNLKGKINLKTTLKHSKFTR